MHEFRQNADTTYTNRRRERALDACLAVAIGIGLAVLLVAGLAG